LDDGILRRDLENQMRLSLRAIISKQMKSGGGKHQVVASFVSDESGFPLTGLKRSGNSIIDMELEEFEQMAAFVPQIWENIQPVSSGLESIEPGDKKISHLIIGFRSEEESEAHLELMITRLEELFLSSIYFAKKR